MTLLSAIVSTSTGKHRGTERHAEPGSTYGYASSFGPLLGRQVATVGRKCIVIGMTAT